MSTQIEVVLMSGRRVQLACAEDASLDSLLQRAQTELAVRGQFSVLSTSGERLNTRLTLGELDLEEGEVLTLHTRPLRLAATCGAFAALLGDGSVATWGANGGDCGLAQQQLTCVQDIQASSGAFAAITDTGCIVAWGASKIRWRQQRRTRSTAECATCASKPSCFCCYLGRWFCRYMGRFLPRR